MPNPVATGHSTGHPADGRPAAQTDAAAAEPGHRTLNLLPQPAWISAVHGLSRGLGVCSALLILVSIAVICQMVFVRTVLHQSSIWQTEFVTFSLIGATFIGAPYILLTRGHVAVDVLPLMLSESARRVLYVVATLIGIAFCGVFLYSAVPWWHDTWVTGQTTSSIWRARLWIPYASVPIGLGLLCLQYLADLWLVLTRRAHPFGMDPAKAAADAQSVRQVAMGVEGKS